MTTPRPDLARLRIDRSQATNSPGQVLKWPFILAAVAVAIITSSCRRRGAASK